MTDLSGPAPADPVAGEPGVFEYIDWLKTSILELDAAKARALDVLAKAGGTMTGNLDANGVVLGDVWDGSWSGLQHLAAGHRSSAGLLLGKSDGSGNDTYLVGKPATGQIRLRPQADNATGTDDVFVTPGGSGLVLVGSPTAANQAATKGYVDKQLIQSGRFQVDATGISTLTYPVTFGAIPNLVCTPNTGDPVMCVISSLSATGASVRIRNLAGSYAGPYFVEWVAVGVP